MKQQKSQNSKPSGKKRGYSPKDNKKNFQPRDKIVELKPVDEVKGFFRDYFRKNAIRGHMMHPEDVKKYILRKLTAKEENVFAQALNALKTEGFIEVQEDGLTLVLTQKGADSFS